MSLLYFEFQIFSSYPTITTTTPINWNLGNACHFKLYKAQLVISTKNVNPSLIYPPPLAIRILGQDFPDLSPNSDDII